MAASPAQGLCRPSAGKMRSERLTSHARARQRAELPRRRWSAVRSGDPREPKRVNRHLAAQFNPPFAVEAQNVIWMKANPYSGNTLETVQKDPRFAKLGVALIDLTGRGRRADGAGWITSDGWNMSKQMFAASLVKIAALFAAFRLRENLRLARQPNERAGRTGGLQGGQGGLEGGCRKKAIPAGKPDFPNLDQIFTISGSSGSWSIDFTREYRKHMEEMIGHSNNHSASVCINRLGFQYLNGSRLRPKRACTGPIGAASGSAETTRDETG